MYRLCSNASRVSHRTWMGARTRRVCEHPSSRHGGAVSEAAVEGTRAWTALGHREVPKKVPTAPLNTIHTSRPVRPTGRATSRVCSAVRSTNSDARSLNLAVRVRSRV